LELEEGGRVMTTKRIDRNDPHSKGRIVPADYAYVTSYYTGGTAAPPLGMKYVRELQATKQFFKHHDRGTQAGKCDVCGAWFCDGEIWRHEPTGEHVHLGQDCARKYGFMVDKSAWELELGRHKAAAAVAIQRARNDEARAVFLTANPGLEADFELQHPLIVDIRARFVSRCTLSPKQVALVHKLADEIRNPRPKVPEAPEAEAPEGRVVVTGMVVYTKCVDTAFGEAVKMLVVVKNEDGSEWKCYGTAPRALLSADAPLRGSKVCFTATLARKERGFAFFSRPSKAERFLEAVV
jgi:hypothetical protein